MVEKSPIPEGEAKPDILTPVQRAEFERLRGEVERSFRTSSQGMLVGRRNRFFPESEGKATVGDMLTVESEEMFLLNLKFAAARGDLHAKKLLES